MKGYSKHTEVGADLVHERLAEAALSRFGLAGASLKLLKSAQNVVFTISFAEGAGLAHPYLGRLDGHRFVLRMQRLDTDATAATRSSLEWLLALARDTELNVPEPVPACDGSLVVQVELQGVHGCWECSVLRRVAHAQDRTTGIDADTVETLVSELQGVGRM